MQQQLEKTTPSRSPSSFSEGVTQDVLATALSSPFDAAISMLCDTRELEVLLEENPSWSGQFLAQTRELLNRAFNDDEQALTQVHAALFTLYELHVSDGASTRASNQFNSLLTQVRSHIERAWLASENRRLPSLAAPLDSQTLVQSLKDLWSQHPVSSHPLFDYLEKEASREQIVTFFRSDSALNIRFFDLLLYSMIGSREGIRKELAQNFWDESGRGDPARSHVRLFRNLLDVVEVGQSADNHASALNWQGLAGHNLFMLTSLNRAHYFKLLGVMSMTELLDPSQYEKLARGCRRVGLGNANELDYYDEHVTIDVIHSEGWLSNVIVPIVDETPSAGADILLGAALRLVSCENYYNGLHARLLALAPSTPEVVAA